MDNMNDIMWQDLRWTGKGDAELDKLVKNEIENMSSPPFDWSGFQIYPFESELLQPWNECKEEMAALSRRFPGVLFSLYGERYPSGDMLVMYVIDGQAAIEYARLAFPPLNRDKLKPL